MAGHGRTAAGRRAAFGAALAGLLLAAGPAAAYDALGMGTGSCSNWVKDRLAPDSAESYADESWVMGFLSGVGFVAKDGANPLHGVETDAVLSWIDRYCRAHLFDSIAKAAAAFVYAHPK